MPILLMLVCALLTGTLNAQPAAGGAAGDLLATVDGREIHRQDLMNLLWAQHANEALNQAVDEILINEALAAWRPTQSKKEKQAVAAEVEARLKRIKSQFKDEATFINDLKTNGMTLEGLKMQMQTQIEREHMVVSANKLAVTPEEIKQFFEANKDKLGGPSGLHLRGIVVANEQQAKDLLVALRVGADFAKLAQQVSIDAGTKDKGGDLGFVTSAMIAPEYQKSVLGLAPGQLSEVVKMPDGFHIFKAEERREPAAPKFEAVRDDLAQAILGQKLSQAYPAYLAGLRAKAKIVPAAGVSVGTPQPPARR